MLPSILTRAAKSLGLIFASSFVVTSTIGPAAASPAMNGLASNTPMPVSAVVGPPLHGPLRPMPAYRNATNVHYAPMPDSQIDAHISPLLPPRERALMRSIMLQLPNDERYNVVYTDLQNVMHVNDPKLLQFVRVYHADPQDPGIGVGNDGSRTVLAPLPKPLAYSCSNPPGDTNGGFREIFSTCGTPYALGHAYLPCKANNQIFLNNPGNEVPYIYEGGFSGSGDPIDGGMQYSYAYDNWAIFMAGDHGQSGINPRYQCNQTVSMEFYVASPTLLAVDVSGYVGGVYQNYTETYQVQSFTGWSPKCPGCIVKRITSLAQNGFGFPNLSTGSYIGIDVNNNPTVNWSNALVGYWNGQFPPRYNVTSWTGLYTGGYKNYPNDGSKVRVIFYNPANEIDGIWLHS